MLMQKRCYFGFFTRKERKFISNVLDEDDLKKSDALKSLSTYYEMFTKFLKVFILLEDSIKQFTNFNEIVDEDLRDFFPNNLGEYDDLEEISKDMKNFQIKNSITKIRVTQQTIAFVYTRMMNFPNSDFSISTFTMDGFIQALHRLTTNKVNLHHSHVD